MKEIATGGAEKIESPRISHEANQNETFEPPITNEPNKPLKE